MSKYLIFISLLLIFMSCKKQTNIPKYDSSPEGITLYSESNFNSNKLALIPFESKVIQINELPDEFINLDENGKWTEIQWNNSKGWVFGGFLRDYNFSELKKAASSYYNNYYKNWFETKYEGDKSNIPEQYAKLYKQNTNNIKIIKSLGNFTIIQHIGRVPLSNEMTEEMEGLWIMKNGKWEVFPVINNDYEHSFYLIKLFRLNDDTRIQT